MLYTPQHVEYPKCGQQARPFMNFVDNTIDLPWRIFLVKYKIWDIFSRENPYVWRYLIFLTAQRNEDYIPKPA